MCARQDLLAAYDSAPRTADDPADRRTLLRLQFGLLLVAHGPRPSTCPDSSMRVRKARGRVLRELPSPRPRGPPEPIWAPRRCHRQAREGAEARSAGAAHPSRHGRVDADADTETTPHARFDTSRDLVPPSALLQMRPTPISFVHATYGPRHSASPSSIIHQGRSSWEVLRLGHDHQALRVARLPLLYNTSTFSEKTKAPQPCSQSLYSLCWMRIPRLCAKFSTSAHVPSKVRNLHTIWGTPSFA